MRVYRAAIPPSPSGHIAALADTASPRKTRTVAEQRLALQPRVHYVPDIEDGRGSSRGNWFYGHTQRIDLHTDLAVSESVSERASE